MEKIFKEAIEELVNEENTKLCEELIRDKNVKSPEFAKAAIKHRIFRPNILYKDASEEVRDELISMLEQKEEDVLNINGILMALAAIGDETVFKYFKKWEENPPTWRKNLYVGPADYAFEGGWCIENNRKKELTHEECYALEEKEECAKEEIVLGGACEDKCPYCNSSYQNLLIIDGMDERLAFLDINGKIKIKYCGSCLPWEEFIYCKYEENGESIVINRDGGSGDFIEDEILNEVKPYVISSRRVSKVYCTEWDKSSIGGAPTFIDDANYAKCPECGKKMRHLAQLGEECTGSGIIYVQICKDCQMAATLYQQS